ncbi:hypothetical protein C0Q70_01584 [Pomacea canaliculata]|uniref:Uncharacterized protein n=1 Tax=Pomacea canaliculata TaxID=400727 RepID=A0A2T7PZX0_POMCA|nr:hypothetical protein C0Q70_01584 [Pomacea canaliculata]
MVEGDAGVLRPMGLSSSLTCPCIETFLDRENPSGSCSVEEDDCREALQGNAIHVVLVQPPAEGVFGALSRPPVSTAGTRSWAQKRPQGPRIFLIRWKDRELPAAHSQHTTGGP